MNIDVFPVIICRTPVFHIAADLCSHFEILTKYIEDAAPDFYLQLMGNNLKVEQKDKGQRSYAIWKYFNRSRFRATPYGRFAAISVINASNTSVDAISKIILKSEINPIHLRDWDDRVDIDISAKYQITSAKAFIKNSTIYRVGNNYRFLSLTDGKYNLIEIEQFAELDWILLHTTEKTSKDVLINTAVRVLKINRARFLRLMVKLIDQQIIWSDKMISITGPDYFLINGYFNDIKRKYFLTERNASPEKYHDPLWIEIKEAVIFLHERLTHNRNISIENFGAAFKRKFDLQFIPLNIALDPELGIEYAGIGLHADLDSKFIDNIFKNNADNNEISNTERNPLAEYISNKMMRGERIIQLEKSTTEKGIVRLKIPNSLSILYQKVDDKLIIQHMGGNSANSLLGRFTVTNDAIRNLGMAIVKAESDANPDVLFFDVNYQAERHIDNVNRRSQLYEFELPLSGYTSSEGHLDCNDIFVGVRDNEVLLYSKRLKKRIIPRIPSAYNHSRSDLAIYRFLADLQNQTLRTSLNISLHDLIPGLDHYSRICYKSLVLSPECWRIPGSILKLVKEANTENQLTILKDWLDGLNGICKFRIGKNDQTLVFDKRKIEDLTALAKFLGQIHEKNLYIFEAFIPKKGVAVDENEKAYAAEMLLSVSHSDCIYQGLSIDDIFLSEKLKRRNYPGGEWLFFEIYTHPIFSNDLLTKYLANLLKANRRLLKKWFFIRYEEGGQHIRLRVELLDPQQSFVFMTGLKNILNDLLNSGKVSDIQIKPYTREYERYNPRRMPIIEELFWIDSELIIRLLKKNIKAEAIYFETLHFMHSLICYTYRETSRQLSFVFDMVKRFNKEFKLDSKAFKQINIDHKKFRYSFKADFTTPVRNRFCEKFKACLAVTPENEKSSLTADIIHMHVNRLFPENQRKHEAILYQFLLNDMKNCHFHLSRQDQS